MKIIDMAAKMFRPDRFKKSTTTQTESQPLRPGRVSQPPSLRQLSPYRSRNTSVLKTLRSTYDAVDAIELLIEESGDISQALYNFVRLANVGHEMQIFALDKKTRLRETELAWRDFASRVNAMSNAGLDGLIDQFHYLAYARGAMACEVEVVSTLDDIVDVYPVNPQTIEWELEERGGRYVWIPYQMPTVDYRGTTKNGKVSLEDANFLWVPTDPKVDDPRGRLLLKPSLSSIDFQIQILNDVQQVLHNQGFPRYDISVDLEKLINIIPPEVKVDGEKLRKWLSDHLDFIKTEFESLNPDDSFVHLSDAIVKMTDGAANSGRGLDVRAIMEMVDIQIMNSVKTPNSMMQRVHSSTETWATVQFRVFVSGLQSIQRGSKRLVENIARLWLRTQGIQAVPVFTHNTIDYTGEKQREEIKTLKAAFYKLSQLMGWIDGNEPANDLFGHDAVSEPNRGGDGDSSQDDGDESSDSD